MVSYANMGTGDSSAHGLTGRLSGLIESLCAPLLLTQALCVILMYDLEVLKNHAKYCNFDLYVL